MSKITLSGLNGQFDFDVYEAGASIDSVPGVFALSRREIQSGKGLNVVLTMGESKDMRAAIAKVADHPVLAEHGFNAICVLPVSDETKRVSIFEELAMRRDLPCGVIRD